MKRLKTELNALVNRGVDEHLRLAVTGLSRDGKTAFITAMWLTSCMSTRARAYLRCSARYVKERLLGVKRVPRKRDFGIPRFTYDEGILPKALWQSLTARRAASGEIRLALRYQLKRLAAAPFKDTSTLYLGCGLSGEWLLDATHAGSGLFSWSPSDERLCCKATRWWAAKWRQLCDGLIPLAPADENRLAEIACRRTDGLFASV